MQPAPTTTMSDSFMGGAGPRSGYCVVVEPIPLAAPPCDKPGGRSAEPAGRESAGSLCESRLPEDPQPADGGSFRGGSRNRGLVSGALVPNRCYAEPGYHCARKGEPPPERASSVRLVP